MVLSEIQNYLDSNSLMVFYQEVKSLKPELSSTYEALVRILIDGEYILPTNFISSAERYSKAGIIDKWVIDNVLSTYHQIFSTGTKISINLSSNSITSFDLIKYIKDKLILYQIEPEWLIFEICEKAATVDMESTYLLIKKLKSLGCEVAIDNFGTGLNSLTFLSNSKVDYIKIDESLTNDIDSNDFNLITVKAIYSLSHLSGIKTVAAKVESSNIINMLPNIGLDYAQGYLISTPLSLLTAGIS
jgi:EAL domain-containing protein (putative c-di-GMP-specific phosphodiesterase class I)